jgi:type IV pilus assembly protein PilP
MIVVTLMLGACVRSKSDLEQYVQDVKKNAKGKVEPLPAPRQIKQVTYSAQSLRSPFVLTGGTYANAPSTVTSASGEVIKQDPRPDLDRPREYLEQFSLASMTMVGTLSKKDSNWGLVRDGNGMIHAVKAGDYLGLNSGVIVAITPDQIRMNETVPNGAGGWMQSRAVLNLVQAAPSTDQDAGQSTPKAAAKPAVQNTPTNTTNTRPEPAAPTAQQNSQPSGFSSNGVRGGI